MKKLLLSAAFVFAFATAATAQDTTTKQTETTTTTTVPATNTTVAPAATATDMADTPAQDDKQFMQVKQSQIAPAVLKEAVAKYKDYSLVEALAATDGSEYKLVLTKDGKDIAAYYTSAGQFIKEVTA